MLTAPIPATKHALKKSNLSLDDIQRVEINEAFASIPLSWQKEFSYPVEQINVNGGAIALGHPLGATGARLMTTLIHDMKRNNIKVHHLTDWEDVYNQMRFMNTFDSSILLEIRKFLDDPVSWSNYKNQITKS